MKRRRARLELVEDRPVRLHKTRFDEERNLSPIQPLTDRQAQYLDALALHKQVIVSDPPAPARPSSRAPAPPTSFASAVSPR